MQPAILTVQNLSLQLANRLILTEVDFAVLQNEILTIIGPNGAGKSSLVKIMLGLLKPTSGQIIKAANLRLGLLPQKITISKLLPLRVLDFLKLPLGWHKSIWPKPPKLELINELLALVKFQTNKLHYALQELSGGELQSVLLIRALLNQPELLVLDEPEQNLDLNAQATFYQNLAQLKQHYNITIVLISHNLNLVFERTDRVICLNQHICCSGRPEEIKLHPAFLALYRHIHDHQH